MKPTPLTVSLVWIVAFIAIAFGVYVDNANQKRMQVETIQLPEHRQVPPPRVRHDRDYVMDCDFHEPCKFVALHEYKANVKKFLKGSSSLSPVSDHE